MTGTLNTTVWADCQGLLAAACDDLLPGELIHGENFSLFDAMAAIEIMDPKMDAGMSMEGFKSAQEVITGGSAPLDLTVPQMLDVMDQLLACEATWQSGHSLAQTVYTCLYLHMPERTAPNAILHAYCKMARSTCNLVRTLVCVADIHEENEDFIGSTFGFPPELEEDSRCMTLLAAVEEMLAKQLKAARAGAINTGTSKLQDDPILEESYCTALLARLRFRRSLHQALTHLDKGPTHEKSTQAAQHALASAARELAVVRISSQQLTKASETSGAAKASPSGQASGGSGLGKVSETGKASECLDQGKDADLSAGPKIAGRIGIVEASEMPGNKAVEEQGAGTAREGGAGSMANGSGLREGSVRWDGKVDSEVTSNSSMRGEGAESGGGQSEREGKSGAGEANEPGASHASAVGASKKVVNELAADLHSSKLSEATGNEPQNGLHSSSGQPALCTAPSDTPHTSERMPFTIHLREGGTTSAPGPNPSVAAGIAAGQPPIHTTDLRQGVTGFAEASTSSGRRAVGFDESVNRRLLASSPPKSMKVLTWTETLDYYDHLLQDLAHVTHAPSATSLASLLQFVTDFSDRAPRIVARSGFFLHLFPEAYLVLGRAPLTEMVLDALHLPQGALRTDPGVLAFSVKAARAVKQLLRLFCTNGARQRRKLARCLAEWEEVRKEAELQDLSNAAVHAWAVQSLEAQKALGPNHPDDPWLGQVFTCWTEQQICRIISRHLSLGFPQNLYSLGEHPVIYWYLSRVFVNYAGLLHNQGTHLLGLHKLQLGGVRRKSKGAEGTARYVPGVDQYLVTIYGRLAWGMVQAFALLLRVDKLPQPSSPSNSSFEPYLQRFAPFIVVQQPLAIPYEEYTGELEYMLSAQYNVLEGALRAFEDAREMTRALSDELPNMGMPRVSQARRMAECRALEQIVQRNTVALKVLAHVGAASTHAVTCDFSYHQFFPVLVVKKVARKSDA